MEKNLINLQIKKTTKLLQLEINIKLNVTQMF